MSLTPRARPPQALELADSETAELLALSTTNASRKAKGQPPLPPRSNPLLMKMDPPAYVLWVLKTVKLAELEAALLVLDVMKVERLVNYMSENLRRGAGVELVARVSIFLVKTHKGQFAAASSAMGAALADLRALLKRRLEGRREMVGFNLAAMKAAKRMAKGRREAKAGIGRGKELDDVWGNLGK